MGLPSYLEKKKMVIEKEIGSVKKINQMIKEQYFLYDYKQSDRITLDEDRKVQVEKFIKFIKVKEKSIEAKTFGGFIDFVSPKVVSVQKLVDHVYIPFKFWEKYDKIQKRKIRKHYSELKKNSELYFLSNTEFKGRLFPNSIRSYIYKRDNYTCQHCLKTKKQLLKEKLHLEVDHIIAWVDGGKTEVSNAETICSKCNKGKHHAKKYLRLVA